MSDSTSILSDSKTIPLSDEKAVKDVLVNTIFELWDIVNNLTRIRPSKRSFYRVTIFGSARIKPDTQVYSEVKNLARVLSAMGCEIVTGGGPGLMQAANEGACEGKKESGQHSVGIRIALPFEQSVNKYVEDVHEHKTFFTRLHHFALASDAFIVVPGGIGTVLETLMVWQLIQVKHLQKMPLVLIGKMYQELVEWSKKHMLSQNLQLANPEDMNIPYCVTDVEQAINLIRDDYQTWLKRKDSVV